MDVYCNPAANDLKMPLEMRLAEMYDIKNAAITPREVPFFSF